MKNSLETNRFVEIAEADRTVADIKVEIGVDFVREVTMTSKLHYTITAYLVEGNVNPMIAFNWYDANSKNGLEISHGSQLYSDTIEATSLMLKKLNREIEEIKKKNEAAARRKAQEDQQKRDAELAALKQKQQQELAELQESHKREFEEKQKALEVRSVWNFSALSDTNQNPATSATSPASHASYSTPSFKTLETICDNCERPGHEMEECWEIHPELRRQAYKNLKNHVCNRCKKVGHHENSCFETIPEKRAAYLKWKSEREAKAQRGLLR